MMFKTAVVSVTLAATVLAGCSAGISPSRPYDAAFFIGTEMSDVSANGLAFADGSQSLEDVEGNTLTVRLVRFQSDPETGETVLIPTTETASIPATFTGSETAYDGSRDVTITFAGETLTFVDGATQLATGQTVNSYLRYRLAHSGVGAIYAYADSGSTLDGQIDMEGFYALGFETNPDVVSARLDQAQYIGSYFGFAQVYDGNDNLVASGVDTRGSIVLEAEFGRARVSGLLTGNLDQGDNATPYRLVFLGAPIVGNGFVGVADMTCPAGNTCTSDTSVGGGFFGPNGEEITGVIAFDEKVTGPDGYAFIGSGGFSTAETPN